MHTTKSKHSVVHATTIRDKRANVGVVLVSFLFLTVIDFLGIHVSVKLLFSFKNRLKRRHGRTHLAFGGLSERCDEEVSEKK